MDMSRDLEEVLRGAAHLLSRLTQYAGLAVPPSSPDERILRVELVEMGTKVLVLVIMQHGQVLTRMIERFEGLDDDTVENIARRLTELTADTSLAAAKASAVRLARESSPAESGLVTMLADVLQDMHDAGAEHVLVGGVGNLAGEL